MVALRNRIAHGYSSLQLDVVWSIVTHELPIMRAVIGRLMRDGGPS